MFGVGMAHLGKHAIVVGAGMGGLLAPRALADHFGRKRPYLNVTQLPDLPYPRKGVPQGRHTHGLLARGRGYWRKSIPGSEGMIAQARTDTALWPLTFTWSMLNFRCPQQDGWARAEPTDAGALARILAACSTTQFRVSERRYVVEPVFHRLLGRVTGVRVRSKDGLDDRETIEADLVVDTSGRGSSIPKWLDAVGFAKPPEEQYHCQPWLCHALSSFQARTYDEVFARQKVCSYGGVFT